MNKRERKALLDNLCITKSEILESIKEDTKHYISRSQDNSCYDLITLLAFLKLCKDKPIYLSGECCTSCANHPKGSMYKIELKPANFIPFLIQKLTDYCDCEIKAYYSFKLNITENFCSIENLLKIKEFEENSPIYYPDKNRRYGEVATRLIELLDHSFWNDIQELTLTDKYAFIFDLICEIGLIPIEPETTDNEKLHKISKYLESYDKFIEKNWAKR